jgi:leader peptidase (prepilin peptidase)/N-methyltransferase
MSGILCGRSKCPHCKEKLGVFDLIPIVSYLYLKGKCRYCNHKISPSYYILEIVTGLVFALTYFFMQELNAITMLFWLIIFSLAIAIAKYDIETQEIPIVLSVSMGITGLILSYFLIGNSFQNILIGGLTGFCFFYLQYYFSKGTWTGLGDADLALVIGIISGPLLLLQNLIISYILGAAVGIYLIIRYKSGLKTQIPFGPFLMLGLFINVLFADEIRTLFFPYL